MRSTAPLRARGSGFNDAIRKVCTKVAGAGNPFCALKDAELDFNKDKPFLLGYGFNKDKGRTVARRLDLWPVTASMDQPGGDYSADGTRANAFQHSYWTALMTHRAIHFFQHITVDDDDG